MRPLRLDFFLKGLRSWEGGEGGVWAALAVALMGSELGLTGVTVSETMLASWLVGLC